MGIAGAVVSVLGRRTWARFSRSWAEPAAAQRDVLRHLLARAADTEWGRRFAFREIRTPQAYRNRVPITDYETAAPLWHRAFRGERDLAWPGHVKYLAMSSGTTAGNKFLPVTRDAVRSNLRAGRLLMAVLARRGGAAALVGGRFLYLGGSTTLQQKGHCLWGDASGIVARHIPWPARRWHLPESDIAALSDWEEKIDRIVARYLTADVCGLSACPSWAAMLFKRMREAARARGLGERVVAELWPKLAHFVSYGMAFGPYRRAFEEYVGRPIHYVDTYSSSEAGMTAIQAEPGGPLAMIVDNGVYYEFIPAEAAGDAQPPRLHIGEVQAGRDYAVVLSSNGGIWAYPLGDVVRFVSLRPPRIVFSARTQIQLSAFGEHVTLKMMEDAVAEACRRTATIVSDYTVWPRYPSPDRPRPGHRWLVEFDRPPADGDAFMAAVDRSIRSENEDYDTHRTNDYGLAPPSLVALARGTFYEWMKRRGKLGGQHKVPRVARSDDMGEELLAISEAIG